MQAHRVVKQGRMKLNRGYPIDAHADRSHSHIRIFAYSHSHIAQALAHYRVLNLDVARSFREQATILSLSGADRFA
jgi:hypothetical protein